MTRSDLNDTEKRRLQANPLCPKCNYLIKDDEKIIFTVKRKRRCKQYVFYHEECLINGEKEEEAKSKG
jgi:hypothetical protein